MMAGSHNINTSINGTELISAPCETRSSMRSKRLEESAHRNARFFSCELGSLRTSILTRLWKPVSSATSNGVTLRSFGTQSEFPEAIHSSTSNNLPSLHSRRRSFASLMDSTVDTSNNIERYKLDFYALLILTQFSTARRLCLSPYITSRFLLHSSLNR